MKKVLFMLLAFITLNTNAQNIVEKTTKSIVNAVDTVKLKTVEGVNFVDTSSTFKTIYSDIKSGITGLAEGLKVGAEHVYFILVKQQIVYSISYTIVYILIGLGWYVFFKNWNIISEETESVANILILVAGTLGTVMLLSFTLTSTITGYLNPEYGAIMDIINFVKH